MPPKRTTKSSGKRSTKKEFIWTGNEAKLLLNVTHDYKVQQLVNGTCWESVKSKDVDILQIVRKELSATEEEASQLFKD